MFSHYIHVLQINKFTPKKTMFFPKNNAIVNNRKISYFNIFEPEKYNCFSKKIYPRHPFAKKSEGFELIDEDYINKKNILLGIASENGDLSMVKKHVESGADIQYNNNYAIKWACRNGHLDIVKYLVENGADIYADNNEPLQWALINNNLEIVEFLIKKDINNHR